MKRTKFRRTKPPHSAEPSYPSVAPVGQAEMSRFSTARQIDESKLPQEYKFYKLNQTSKAYKLPLEELKKKYLAFLKTKERSWILYHGHNTVTTFVTSREGLASSIDVTELIKLEMVLTKTRHALYPVQNKSPKLKRTKR